MHFLDPPSWTMVLFPPSQMQLMLFTMFVIVLLLVVTPIAVSYRKAMK